MYVRVGVCVDSSAFQSDHAGHPGEAFHGGCAREVRQPRDNTAAFRRLRCTTGSTSPASASVRRSGCDLCGLWSTLSWPLAPLVWGRAELHIFANVAAAPTEIALHTHTHTTW